MLSISKTSLIALLLGIVLVSCVPAKVWHQEGADVVQREAAVTQCSQAAQADVTPIELIALPDYFGAYLNLYTNEVNDLTKYYRALDINLFERLSEAFIDEVDRIDAANPEAEIELSVLGYRELVRRLERLLYGQTIYTASGLNQVGIVWGLESNLESLFIKATNLVTDPNNLVRPNWNYGNVRSDIEGALNSYRNDLNNDIVSKNNQRLASYRQAILNQTSKCMLANGWQRVSVEELAN